MEYAELILDGKSYKLPVYVGSEQEKAIDISRLRSDTGYIVLDQGYGNTGACKSAITFLNGEEGILRHRGYNIAELCEKSRFIEVSYLLIYGELPTSAQLEHFEYSLLHHTLINEEYKKYYDVWPNTAHPMALLSSALSGMSTFYHDSDDIHNKEQIELSTIRCMAKIPTLAAYAYKKSIGQPFIYPKNNLNYSGNFLNMMFALPTEDYQIDPDLEKALNQLFILHADHEQNCSTSTVRIVGSSHSNLYGSVAAGILALWGSLHGGANQAVLEMLIEIQNGGSDVETFIKRAKDPNDKFRLMGFGHRVYKNSDPRATVIRETCDRVLKKLKRKEPLLDLAKQLEERALGDPYFIERKLYPNVDFYSGILYKAMGIPVNMFTVIFAIGRLPGWIAHWREMMEDPATKIGRPRQIYTGYQERAYVPISERG